MCCEHLVCARCAQPVADGCCAVCRAARDQMHPRAGLSGPLLVWLAALLAVAALLSVHASF